MLCLQAQDRCDFAGRLVWKNELEGTAFLRDMRQIMTEAEAASHNVVVTAERKVG